MCQALCWALRITQPGGETNTIFQMGKLRFRGSLIGEGAEDWQPGPSDSRPGATQSDHPCGDAVAMREGTGERDGGAGDGKA